MYNENNMYTILQRYLVNGNPLFICLHKIMHNNMWKIINSKFITVHANCMLLKCLVEIQIKRNMFSALKNVCLTKVSNSQLVYKIYKIAIMKAICGIQKSAALV